MNGLPSGGCWSGPNLTSSTSTDEGSGNAHIGLGMNLMEFDLDRFVDLLMLPNCQTECGISFGRFRRNRGAWLPNFLHEAAFSWQKSLRKSVRLHIRKWKLVRVCKRESPRTMYRMSLLDNSVPDREHRFDLRLRAVAQMGSRLASCASVEKRRSSNCWPMTFGTDLALWLCLNSPRWCADCPLRAHVKGGLGGSPPRLHRECVKARRGSLSAWHKSTVPGSNAKRFLANWF